MVKFKALGKKPPTQNGSSLNEEHFQQALVEAADALERVLNYDKVNSLRRPVLAEEVLIRDLRVSAGVEKK